MYVPDSARYVIILILVFIIQSIQSATEQNLLNDNAVTVSYSSCKRVSNTSIDCSNLMLKSLPNDIPNEILTINISSNNLKLDELTFATCCINLLELDLSNNEITNISQDVFKNLFNITTILLRNNSIGEFDSDTFSSLSKLDHLDLSKNPLVLQKDFINNSKLTTLNLDDCNLSEIPEGTFSGIKQLESLTLTKNLLDEDFDSTAFEDLQSLTKLEMRNVSQESIEELCQKLTTIDTINFDGFNFSCFIFMAEENFEDAIVGNDPPIQQPVIIPRTTTSTKSPTTSVVTTPISTTLSASQNITTAEIHVQDQEHLDNPATTESVDHATVEIDNETIKFILVAIFVATITGSIIGLICREDVFGIKTKMCRSKKANNNRRTPADTVSPFEEIPLNTVTINSNGKTIEGQG